MMVEILCHDQRLMKLESLGLKAKGTASICSQESDCKRKQERFSLMGCRRESHHGQTAKKNRVLLGLVP
jgi:hypothetical protein